jgi:hypothetical protein
MPTKRTRVVIAVVLLAGAIVVGWMLDASNKAAVKRCDHPFTDLQKAWTKEKAREILMDWNAKNQNAAIKCDMRLDLTFPFFYAPLLALLCSVAAVGRPTRWVALLGQAVTVGVLLAGLCDLAENTTMLTMVGHEELAGRLRVMLCFTWSKNILLMLGFFYVMLAHLDTRDLPSPT